MLPVSPSEANPLSRLWRGAFLGRLWWICNYMSIMGKRLRVGQWWQRLQRLLTEGGNLWTNQSVDTIVPDTVIIRRWRSFNWKKATRIGVWRVFKVMIVVLTETVHRHMQHYEVEYLQFAFRWMNNLLMRELPLRCTIRLWDTYQVHTHTHTRMFVCMCPVFIEYVIIWWDMNKGHKHHENMEEDFSRGTAPMLNSLII